MNSLTFNPTRLSRRIEAIPEGRLVVVAVLAIATTGAIDHLTGPVVSLVILYLVPVAVTAWVAGVRPALALAVLAATTWAVADRVGPLAEPKAGIAYLNDVSMFLVFLIVIGIISILRREIRKQRDLMQQVQRHLLPEALSSIPGLQVAARWIPAWTVAGDYYDVMNAGTDRVALCLADVSGKGLTAALIMSNVQAIMRSVATDRRQGPGEVLATLNHILCERLPLGFFVTGCYGVVDMRTRTFSFSNAGHPPAILRRACGRIERLESTGPVAGILPAATYRCVDVQLGEGDCIVLYSDGVTEYENRAGEEFGEARLRDLLSQSGARTAEETCTMIVAALHDFGQGRLFDDDVTMLVTAVV